MEKYLGDKIGTLKLRIERTRWGAVGLDPMLHENKCYGCTHGVTQESIIKASKVLEDLLSKKIETEAALENCKTRIEEMIRCL
ncbi:hypothetical protein PP178_04275 [Zeaxanthinibacter sp. PT1]|uniref:hypothetical protein n=1 Tax=Zeaxanthinibacter TaxID=561554 RepID=UPI00234A58A6|nr:hypothetical protein [Zeaxanthinibacter sp. PT1]MDC6350756.1 hypothetical protein [Zeaxanthinibacter sp. PT1]